MRKNQYAKELQARKQMETALVQTWTAQLCLDIMTLVLNDPDIMGKDRFGRVRLRRVGAGFNRKFREACDALTMQDNASHIRAQIDHQLEKIAKSDFIPWAERYDLWNDRGI